MHIAREHPSLPGHFPDHPVVPGVVLLDSVIQSLAHYLGHPVRITGFPTVKFLAPLTAEQEFEVDFQTKRAGQAQFEILAQGEKLASGSINFDEIRP